MIEKIEPGLKLGMLTVVEEAEQGSLGSKQWLCKCDCGNDFVALDTPLKRSRVKSCGCAHSFSEGDITGCRYGRLEVLYRTIDNPSGHPQFACQCDCGNVVLMSWSSLTNGSEVPSCGCYASETRAIKATKHGLVGTPLHRVWNHMRDRCNNPMDNTTKSTLIPMISDNCSNDFRHSFQRFPALSKEYKRGWSTRIVDSTCR